MGSAYKPEPPFNESYLMRHLINVLVKVLGAGSRGNEHDDQSVWLASLLITFDDPFGDLTSYIS